MLCGDIGQPGLDICHDCEVDLPRLGHHCQHCALPLPSPEQTLCGHCQLMPPPFQRTVAIYLYQYPVAELIAGFKYNRQLSYGKVLSLTGLNGFVSAYTYEFPDIITPIPLHWRRRLKRGFNQSEQIATYLAKGMDIPTLPLLQRSQFTPPQQQLDAQQRRQNLRGAFEATQNLAGQCVAVVDDVMTTGATATEVSKVLLEAGAGEVHIWVLARTP
ncbi:hypothetical protein BST96_08885 [Oceanicoccus sagamiensis]|uniref:Uncharacterized protein n=1 Tax=Oceanicoccus sagamiensis TaxID=716816 RepID=A0A1X9NLV6_9GAMM|nr:hypothetical protein BST96_08885 [Oceanicoccus sagamiensis]